MTVRKVLESLQEQGPLSRADLTRETGISAPTISKAVSELLTTGLLEEGAAPDNALGRPGRKLQLARDSAHVIGIVLDPESCHVVSASLDGTIAPDSRISFTTPGTYDSLIDSLKQACDQVMRITEYATLGIGITMPGLVNEETDESLFSPNLHVINHRRPAADLAALTGTTAVCLQESRALCLGERLYGQARGLNDFAMLDVTTGLGLGVFSNGELIRGQNGLAGELGHFTVAPGGRLCGCGNYGCLETLATDAALATAVSERLGRRMSTNQVITELQTGQLTAPDDLKHVCEYLSIAMAATINLFNPSTLFVFGQLLSVSDEMMQKIVRMTQQRALAPSFERCSIELAAANKEQGAIAAIVHHLTRSAGPRVAG